MHPDEMPATLSAPRTHTDVAWTRLLNEGSPVGYLRQTRTGGTLYSKDGYGWSGQPIDHDQELPQLMVNLYRHRIFHGDIVEMRPRAGVQAYHPMIVLVSGDSVCLYDQQVGRLVTMEDAWPPPSSPRAQRVLGSMYTDVAFGRRIDTLFVEHLAGPRVDLPDSFTLLGLMHLGLLASIGLQFVVWGHAGPVLSSLGVLCGSIVHFARNRKQEWSSLSRAPMLRQSLYLAVLTGGLWGSLQGVWLLGGGSSPDHSNPWVSVVAMAGLGGLIGMVATVIGADLVAWRTGGYADDPGPENHFRDLG